MTMHHSSRSQRAYTMVEVMMALAMLTIGCVGVAALASTVIRANQDARDFDMATSFARAWMDRLRATSTGWIAPQVFPPEGLGVNLGGGWMTPTTTDSLRGGLNAVGTPITPGSEPRGPHLCAQIQLDRGPNNQLVVARVRVIWPRTTLITPNPMIADGRWCRTPNDASDNPFRYHAIYLSSTLRQNTAP